MAVPWLTGRGFPSIASTKPELLFADEVPDEVLAARNTYSMLALALLKPFRSSADLKGDHASYWEAFLAWKEGVAPDWCLACLERLDETHKSSANAKLITSASQRGPHDSEGEGDAGEGDAPQGFEANPSANRAVQLEEDVAVQVARPVTAESFVNCPQAIAVSLDKVAGCFGGDRAASGLTLDRQAE